MRVQLGRRVDVAVVVRRALQQLAVVVAVAARDLDQAGRLEDEVALISLGPEAVDRPARDDDVVALLVRQLAEHRLERPVAFVDEDALVALAVPEEVVHLLGGAAERDLDVVVPHQDAAAGDLVAFRVDPVGVEMAVRVRFGNPLVALDLLERAELLDTARALEVVQDRLHPGEALQAHDLFGQERPVVPKLRMPLPGHRTKTLVEGHAGRIPGDPSTERSSLAPPGSDTGCTDPFCSPVDLVAPGADDSRLCRLLDRERT